MSYDTAVKNLYESANKALVDLMLKSPPGNSVTAELKESLDNFLKITVEAENFESVGFVHEKGIPVLHKHLPKGTPLYTRPAIDLSSLA